MDLYIVRHAWAGQRGDPRWPDDDLRPLTEDGKERFAKVAAKLVERGMNPQLIATSPLVRCVETAKLLAVAVGKVKIVDVDQLRPGSGDFEGLLDWTTNAARSHPRIAWVGHAPDVDRIGAVLIGDASGMIRFTKGGAACIRFEGPAEIGAGDLQWLVTAKILGC